MSLPNAFRRSAMTAVLAGAVYVAGCSSSSTPSASPTAAPTVTPTMTPTPAITAIPTATPTSASNSTVLTNDLVFPPVGGYGASMTFSSNPVPAGVTVVLTGTTYAPAGIPTNAPSAMPSPVAGGVVPATVLAAWTIVLNSTVTVPSPSVAFTGLPTPPAGTGYYSYFADITAGGGLGYSGPANYSSGTAVIPPGNGGATMLTGGHTFVLEVVNF